MKTKDLLESHRSPNQIIQLLTEGFIKMSGEITLESTDFIRLESGRELQLSEDFVRGQELEIYAGRGRTKTIPVEEVSFVRFGGTQEHIPVMLNDQRNGLVIDEDRYFENKYR